MKNLSRIIALTLASSLGACGGGAGGTSMPISPATGTPSSSSALVSVAAASVTISMSGLPVAGQAGSFPLTIAAKDKNGNVITGPYATPIVLTNSDATGTVALAAASVKNASAVVTLTYSGRALAGPVTIGATVATGTINVTPLAFDPNDDHPITSGLSATYTQTSTATQVFPAPGPTYVPFVIVEPSYLETMVGGASFNGVTNLTDEHDTFNYTPGSSGSSTSDEYLQFAGSAGASSIVEVGITEDDLQSSPTDFAQEGTTSFTEPYQVIDELPHRAGNTWSGMVPETTNQSSNAQLPATYTSTKINADGSVTERQNSGATLTDLAIHSDGSTLATVTAGATSETLTLGLPTMIGGQQVVAFTTIENGVQSSVNVPDWYPNGGAPTPVIASKVTDNGTTTIPAQCNVAPVFGTTAEKLHTNQSILLTIAGEYEVTDEDQYIVANVGLVCDVQSATTSLYDQFTDGKLASTSVDVTVTSIATGSFGPLARRRAQSIAAPFVGFGHAIPELVRKRALSAMAKRVALARFGG